jgi:hypothetical protein
LRQFHEGIGFRDEKLATTPLRRRPEKIAAEDRV